MVEYDGRLCGHGEYCSAMVEPRPRPRGWRARQLQAWLSQSRLAARPQGFDVCKEIDCVYEINFGETCRTKVDDKVFPGKESVVCNFHQ